MYHSINIKNSEKVILFLILFLLHFEHLQFPLKKKVGFFSHYTIW